jgi:hypothetical protein
VSHQVKVLASGVELPDGNIYQLNTVVTLTDEQFEQIAAAAFTGGILQDLGYVAISGASTVRNWVSGTLLPSATANTPGAAQTMLPSGGHTSFPLLELVIIVFGGTFASETASVVCTATFLDSTTASWTLSATTSSTVSMTVADMATLMEDNSAIAQVAVTIQSTIANSQVAATARVVALQN